MESLLHVFLLHFRIPSSVPPPSVTPGAPVPERSSAVAGPAKFGGHYIGHGDLPTPDERSVLVAAPAGFGSFFICPIPAPAPERSVTMAAPEIRLIPAPAPEQGSVVMAAPEIRPIPVPASGRSVAMVTPGWPVIAAQAEFGVSPLSSRFEIRFMEQRIYSCHVIKETRRDLATL
jgi:hypothetical protein